jgi:hypothetical protein
MVPTLSHLSSTSVNAVRATFRHETLNRTTHSFRLVKVLPYRSIDNLLQLSLWHGDISSTAYSCLSYRWGEQSRRHTVLVNGKEFFVGENLHSFLEEAHTWTQGSSNCDDGVLWIDSICINQDSVEERGHQVQLMGRIYTNAKEVFVWLGHESTSIHSFHDWLQSETWIECPESLRAQWDMIRLDPYWCRAWIVQEILLARHVVVLLRGMRLDYASLGRAIARSADPNDIDDDSAAQLWTFWASRWKKPQHKKRDSITVDWLRYQRDRDRDHFWSLIHMHKSAKCTDVRDRIYSLLGLISGDHSFKVDYSENAVDLFWRAGEHFDAWEAPELVDILRVALFKEGTLRQPLIVESTLGFLWIL